MVWEREGVELGLKWMTPMEFVHTDHPGRKRETGGERSGKKMAFEKNGDTDVQKFLVCKLGSVCPANNGPT